MPDINMQVFEETKRNQLVTEVDIQTQVALDDYQVQLSDIANPTQSQDNVVVDRFGEFLPHWNESLDFDTWVKMSMEVAGKRILMLRGNSSASSASNASNVFDFFDDFSGDLSKWNVTESTGGNVAIVSNELRIIGNNAWNANGVGSKIAVTRPSIIEYDFKYSSTAWGSLDGYGAYPLNYNSGYFWEPTTSDIIFRLLNGARTGDLGTPTSDTFVHNTVVLKSNGSEINYNSNEITNVDSGYTTDNLYIIFNIFRANYMYVDNVIARQYTATIPMWLADGEEQNIAVALKSLGRAG